MGKDPTDINLTSNYVNGPFMRFHFMKMFTIRQLYSTISLENNVEIC